MSDDAQLLEVANAAVDLAADMFRSRRPASVTTKADRDFVSDSDFSIERAVRTFLLDETPDICFLGEEEGSRGIQADRPYWALDPIDGTSNFVHGIPLCAIALGLIYEKRPTLGVVDLPLLTGRYTAVQGRGAHLNGEQLRVSQTRELARAMVSIGDYAVGVDASRKNDQRIFLTHVLAERVERVRMIGAAAVDLVWIAQGCLDGTIILSNKPWDTAAGTIIAREAGATVLDIDGSRHTLDSQATIAAAPGVIDDLVSLVSGSVGPMRRPAVDAR